MAPSAPPEALPFGPPASGASPYGPPVQAPAPQFGQAPPYGQAPGQPYLNPFQYSGVPGQPQGLPPRPKTNLTPLRISLGVAGVFVVGLVVTSVALFSAQRDKAGQSAVRTDLRLAAGEINAFYLDADEFSVISVDTSFEGHNLYCDDGGTGWGYSTCDSVTPVVTFPASDGVTLFGWGEGSEDWCVEGSHEGSDQVMSISAQDGLRENWACP
jgi:hypothetical protein